MRLCAIIGCYMALSDTFLFKGLIAISILVLSVVFLRLFAVPNVLEYLPWILGFIFFAVNSRVQYFVLRGVGIIGYTLTWLITTFGIGLYRLYLKTRRAYVVVVLLLAFVAMPTRAYALDFTRPPTRIIIPQARISLPVFTAKIAYDTWEVREDGASFGDRTTLPGTPGNTVIFSHAMPHLFGNLGALKKGAHVHVFTDLDWFVYEVTDIKVVAPEDTEVIFQGENHELTLFTCTGPSYSKRLVVKARLITPPTP